MILGIELIAGRFQQARAGILEFILALHWGQHGARSVLHISKMKEPNPLSVGHLTKHFLLTDIGREWAENRMTTSLLFSLGKWSSSFRM